MLASGDQRCCICFLVLVVSVVLKSSSLAFICIISTLFQYTITYDLRLSLSASHTIHSASTDKHSSFRFLNPLDKDRCFMVA